MKIRRVKIELGKYPPYCVPYGTTEGNGRYLDYCVFTNARINSIYSWS